MSLTQEHRRGTARGSGGLWAQLPDDVAEAFRPYLPDLMECVLREIKQSVPAYSVDDPVTDKLIVIGVESGVRRCLTDIAGSTGRDDDPGYDEWRALFARFGAREYREGRSLDSLLAAYRTAGQTSWRYLAGWGQSLQLAPEVLCSAAEAVFATINDISALSVAGYSEARVADESAAERHRARLLTLLVSDPPPTKAAIAALAEVAGWALPARIRVVALAHQDSGSAGMALDPAVLRDLDGPRPCLVTGAPDVHLARLAARLGGRRAAIGPLVLVTEAAASYATARRALDLAAAGTLPDEPVLHCDEHLLSMWLTTDPFLAGRVCRQALAPFGDLPRRQAERLADTLLSWLRHNGHVVEVAQALQIHPQTVRYRLNQLTELFGTRLDDPDERLAMEMALRTCQLVGWGYGEPYLSETP